MNLYVPMNVSINKTWLPYLEAEFSKPYFESLAKFVKSEYQHFECFPQAHQIFNAFDFCEFENLKVVILGQDPYHGLGQANGMCFSVNAGVKHPPSLVNIFRELEQDLKLPYPICGNLEPWAKQGVLLLNATLTVRSREAGSHQNKGWEQFTDAVISVISEQKQGVVFLLWGNYAKKKSVLIDKKKHTILIAGHPSPLSANRGLWFGNKHFSQTNFLLEQAGRQKIDWQL